mmetsp:Transcript_27679/g.64389  ORF Transcript_27679/g.64389 Transcript_27679/m.64389 type:complete len:308 (-) Transcript_27679:281-1204(-)
MSTRVCCAEKSPADPSTALVAEATSSTALARICFFFSITASSTCWRWRSRAVRSVVARLFLSSAASSAFCFVTASFSFSAASSMTTRCLSTCSAVRLAMRWRSTASRSFCTPRIPAITSGRHRPRAVSLIEFSISRSVDASDDTDSSCFPRKAWRRRSPSRWMRASSSAIFCPSTSISTSLTRCCRRSFHNAATLPTLSVASASASAASGVGSASARSAAASRSSSAASTSARARPSSASSSFPKSRASSSSNNRASSPSRSLTFPRRTAAVAAAAAASWTAASSLPACSFGSAFLRGFAFARSASP